jgi:peptide deformylase
MAILDIKKYPDAILRRKAVEIRKVGEGERKLAYDMIETMRHFNGIGLAGPQVGIGKCIIVADAGEDGKSSLALINPKIIKKKGRSVFCEGCLSIPGINKDVIRAEAVIVEALNLDGDVLKIETGGLLARILQHEIDHLNGILFVDHINFLKRKKILNNFLQKKI